MLRSPINLAEKLAKVSELWTPRVVAEMTDYQFTSCESSTSHALLASAMFWWWSREASSIPVMRVVN